VTVVRWILFIPVNANLPSHWYDHPFLFWQFLPKNLHLVCVDLPGHEGTTRSALDDYSIMGQAKRIHQVKPLGASLPILLHEGCKGCWYPRGPTPSHSPAQAAGSVRWPQGFGVNFPKDTTPSLPLP